MLPEYTNAERLIDGIIHFVGLALSVAAFAVLISIAAPSDNATVIIAVIIYSIGMIAMYGLSSIYNLVSSPKWKEAIRRYDHAAIYVMIAGTYTPFAIIGIGGWVGYGLLALVWAVALFGLLLKLLWPRRLERTSIALYLALGWIGVPALGLMLYSLGTATLILIGIGGVLYSIGVAFHLWERLPYQNAVWHGFVLSAASVHFAAVVVTTLNGVST